MMSITAVLDSVNCLREEGGQLVVSERGVLWGQVVTVPDTSTFVSSYCMTS